MENTSENKSGRGRRPKYDMKSFASATGNSVIQKMTTRNQQNYFLAGIAARALASDKLRFSYLLTPKLKMTILAELGRLPNDETRRHAAAQICEMKWPTRKAVLSIKSYRLGSRPNTSDLIQTIIRAIDKYRERHPTLTAEQINLALRSVKIKPSGFK